MSKLVSFAYSCPDPSEDKNIVILMKDGSLIRCRYIEKSNGAAFWASEDTYSVFSKDCQGFIDGNLKWIYKKDLYKYIDLFSKQHICKEDTL